MTYTRATGPTEMAGPSPPTPDGRQPSTADLVKQASEQLTRLVRDEIRLAQAELRAKGRHAGAGVGLFSGAGVILLYGFGALVAAAVLGIAVALPGWLAALIVGAALFLLAGVMALVGRGQIRRASPPYPTEAVESTKTTAAALRERAGR